MGRIKAFLWIVLLGCVGTAAWMGKGTPTALGIKYHSQECEGSLRVGYNLGCSQVMHVVLEKVHADIDETSLADYCRAKADEAYK